MALRGVYKITGIVDNPVYQPCLSSVESVPMLCLHEDPPAGAHVAACLHVVVAVSHPHGAGTLVVERVQLQGTR